MPTFIGDRIGSSPELLVAFSNLIGDTMRWELSRWHLRSVMQGEPAEVPLLLGCRAKRNGHGFICRMAQPGTGERISM